VGGISLPEVPSASAGRHHLELVELLDDVTRACVRSEFEGCR
jgi:hypothetical protein